MTTGFDSKRNGVLTFTYLGYQLLGPITCRFLFAAYVNFLFVCMHNGAQETTSSRHNLNNCLALKKSRYLQSRKQKTK